jgi:putative ABC transport system permease protein
MSTALTTQTRNPSTSRPWLGGLPEFYALRTIWHERSRFLPAILAVAFSAMLIAVQAGLLVGLLSMMSTPVDRASADIWVGYSGVKSLDLGLWIQSEEWELRLKTQPEVESVESVVMSFSQWAIPSTPERPEPFTALVTVIGTSLDPNSIALLEPLRGKPEVLAALHERYTIAIDESECSRLGVRGVDDVAVIMGQSVRVVGLVKGLKSLAGAYVFCSADTARHLLGYRSNLATYVLAKVRDPKDAEQVVQRMRGYSGVSVFTKDEFSVRSRLHWMFTTQAGLALAFTAFLGLLVGAVVTSQTLYAATAAAQREFATLRAMGIPRWRLQLSVIAQSFWVGMGGILVAAPITLILAEVAALIGTRVKLPLVIVIPSAAITMGMALMSGLLALRSLQRTDPVHNIR